MEVQRRTDDTWKAPQLIQGGMGAGVSNWRLARAVSAAGQLGVVSGTAINTVLVRRLQDGDSGGDVRRALAHFPDARYAADVVARFFVSGGRGPKRPYSYCGVPSLRSSVDSQRLSVVGAFVEVWLAKEGHGGEVGINFLEKLQLSNLPAMYGAMLAGVDYVLVGAGVPRDVPAALERFVEHAEAACRVALDEDLAPGAAPMVSFAPREVFPELVAPALRRPRFLAIVASASLAEYLLRHASGRIDGFVVEGPTAGGHNAPPRGALRLSERGEPIYSDRDLPDAAALRKLGLPFWFAGSWDSRESLGRAIELGASGVQVGTAFALCEESGLAPALRAALIEKWVLSAAREDERVFTDPFASPTQFPFKVAALAGSLSEPEVYAARERVCDLGYLRSFARRADGRLVYRCPAEPVDDYVRKGGAEKDTLGRKCLCNALLSNVGLAQVRASGAVEPPLLTAGDGIATVHKLFGAGASKLHAADVVLQLVGEERASV